MFLILSSMHTIKERENGILSPILYAGTDLVQNFFF